MINNKEILISGKSYISKDFASIYPEEVDLFKKLTNRYDPETSNESDPFIVNLKTNAFIADKLNYNIDKNVLENFMPSATQETSMRDLCGRLGYDMKYYRASSTEIYIKYTGSVFTDYANAYYFDIPRFTEITSQGGDISFVTVNRKQYTKNDDYITINALQGVVKTLEVADSDIIQLSNLNSQNRIYFNESIVAENGIFVSSVDDERIEWKQTDNLNLELPETPCYKFGYDSVNRWPYIEFPTDIASIIGSGLKINYIVTQGDNGNVKANYLTSISNYSSFNVCASDGSQITDTADNPVTVSTSDEDDELIVKNTSSAVGGANPETIDEAYNNFKKTVGTFDTLVTCRDYANAIYNLYTDSGLYPAVSNVQVGDRRDDINYSNKILTLDEYGSKYIYGNTGSSITAYELCLYPLNTITDYNSDEDGYIESFRPKLNTTYITQSLEESKAISHDYKELSAEDIYAIKNMYKLNVKLTTTYKVNQYERLSIITNVLNAIVKNFNAREVDYGEEIPYDSIVEVIKNADERINYVSMAEPEITPTFMLKSGNEYAINTENGRSKYLSIVAKNILAGRISLFDFYDAFNFEFNQSDGNVGTHLEEIQSIAEIELANESEYTLGNNEAIQVIGPSFVTVVPYGYGIRYIYTGSEISAKSEYELKDGESLKVKYKASSDATEYIIKEYVKGDIIKPNFDLVDTSTITGTTVDKVDGLSYAMISSEQEIDIRKLNNTTLTGFTYCYWLRNSTRNTLFSDDNSSVYVGESGEASLVSTMLQDGEYFFYKTGLKDDFISLGSGTILTIPLDLYRNNNWSADTTSMDDILKYGSDSIKWKTFRFDASNYFNIQETTILTLTSGDKIKLSGLASSITLNNNLQVLDADVNIGYTISGESPKPLGKIETTKDNDQYKWRIKSRLDIDAGPELSQFIDGANSTHKIRFKLHNGSYLPKTGYYGTSSNTGYSFMLDSKQQFVGSEHINTSSYDITESIEENRIKYPISVYVFKAQEEGNNIEYYRNESGFINVNVDDNTFTYVDANTTIFPSTITLPISDKDCILTIYYQKDGQSTNDFPTIYSYSDAEAKTSVEELERFNETVSPVDNLTLREGINSIKIGSGVKAIKFECSEESAVHTSGIMSLGKLSYYSGYNSTLGLLAGEATTLLEDINDIDVNHNFYYDSAISSDNLIDVDDLSSADAFYNYNNIANKFTISEINISKDSGSVIDVVKTSLL